MDPCRCTASPTNPHAASKRPDGLPALCTTPDHCGHCGGDGFADDTDDRRSVCTACQGRGYSQHCERVVQDGVEVAGWAARLAAPPT